LNVFGLLKKTYILGIAIDITRLKSLNLHLEDMVEQELAQRMQLEKLLAKQTKLAALGEMMDAIEHQWKNPLGVIKLYMDCIELNPEDHQETVKYTQKTVYQIDHLLNTIDEFRSFFRPSKKREEVKIKKIIEDTISLMKDELIKNAIEVEIGGDEEGLFTIIPNEFKHVLINLFNNSKDAFNDHNIKNRVIKVFVETNEKENILKICDNAGGIPEDILENIFMANFTTKEEGKGTGRG